MENSQSRDLLEVVFLIKGQDFADRVILHDDAVNYVSHAGMIFQDALPNMVEKL